MAIFITTTEISFRIENAIRNAEKYIVLISPYIKIHKRLKDLITAKQTQSRTQLVLVYGKKELNDKELRWFLDLPKTNIFFREELHAKCYLNESEAIVTSMNLYDYSMVNNIEFGTVFSASENQTEYERIFSESNSLTEGFIMNFRNVLLEQEEMRLRAAHQRELAKFDLSAAMEEAKPRNLTIIEQQDKARQGATSDRAHEI